MAQEILIEPRERSAGEIVEDVIRDLGNIVRSEIQLARTEVTEKATLAARGGSMLGVGAVIGLLAAMACIATCIAVLALAMPVWAAALLMTFVLAVTAAILVSAGRNRLKSVRPVARRTERTLKDDLQWAKQRSS